MIEPMIYSRAYLVCVTLPSIESHRFESFPIVHCWLCWQKWQAAWTFVKLLEMSVTIQFSYKEVQKSARKIICKIWQHLRIILLINRFNLHNLLPTTKSFFIQIDWRDSSFQKIILNLLNKKLWLNFDKDWLASHWNDTAFQYFTWVVTKDIKRTYEMHQRFDLDCIHSIVHLQST